MASFHSQMEKMKPNTHCPYPQKQLGSASMPCPSQWETLTVLNDDFDESDRASPGLGKEFL